MSKTVNFAAWIKDRLKEKAGWTAGTLAERARISRAAAYFYLDGTRVPTEVNLLKIAVALGLNGVTSDMTRLEILEKAAMPAFTPRSTK